MLRRFSAVARTAFVETLAEPVSALLLMSAVLVVHLAPVMQFTLLSEPGRLARDGGFSAILVFGSFLAVSAALRAVGREISSGTAAAALSLPVSRPVFLAGKIAGVVSAFLIFSVATTCATVLSEGSCVKGLADAVAAGDGGAARVSKACLAAGVLSVGAAIAVAAALHRFFNARFAPALFLLLAASQVAALPAMVFSAGVPADTRVFPVAAPIAAYVCVLAVAAATFACRLRPAAAGACTAALFACSAFVSLLPRAAGTVAGAVVPDLRNFWLADALSYTGAVPWGYAASACGGALALSAFWFAAGCIAFANRDLG